MSDAGSNAERPQAPWSAVAEVSIADGGSDEPDGRAEAPSMGYLPAFNEAAVLLPLRDAQGSNGSLCSGRNSVSVPSSSWSHPRAGTDSSYRWSNTSLIDTSRDSFGNRVFHPIYPECGESPYRNFPPHLAIPSEIQEEYGGFRCTYFDILFTRHFWYLVEFALRVTLIGMLIPAALIAADLPYTPFVSRTFALSSVVVAAGETVGDTVMYLWQFIKAAFIWVPLTAAAAAVGLQRSMVAWLITYSLLIFLMAFFTERATRRVSILLFNTALVSQLRGNDSLLFPTRILGDWALGAAFSIVAMVLPYPVLSSKRAECTLRMLFGHLTTAFNTAALNFWVASNLERSQNMVRVRYLGRTLDSCTEVYDRRDSVSHLELFVFESKEKRDLRRAKAALVKHLRLDLRSMVRAVEMVLEHPKVVDDSPLCVAFGERMSSQIVETVSELALLLEHIEKTRRLNDVRELEPMFDMCARQLMSLQSTFDGARKDLLYGEFTGSVEDWVPLMTFFVFTIVSFGDTLRSFKAEMDSIQPQPVLRSLVAYSIREVSAPFVANAMMLRRLVVHRDYWVLREVLEAAKVSVAMLISLIFYFYAMDQRLLLSGPAIIAFVLGSSPVEAFQASIDRLIGTLIGFVLGFFAESLSSTPMDTVIALCVITAALTFLRTSPTYGVICMYANFVAVTSLNILGGNADEQISRMQQNTFSVFIYCAISVLVFPMYPSDMLMRKRRRVLEILCQAVCKSMSMLEESLQSPDELLDVHTVVLKPVCAFDASVAELFAHVDEMFQILHSTQSLMSLVRHELSISPVVYPSRACEAVNTSLYHACSLVRTMACGWKLLRDKSYFSRETRRVMRNLLPVAQTISCSFQRFTLAFTFFLRHHRAPLFPELARASAEVQAVCDELYRRLGHDFLVIIDEALREQEVLSLSRRTYVGSTGVNTCATGTSPPNTSPTTSLVTNAAPSEPIAGWLVDREPFGGEDGGISPEATVVNSGSDGRVTRSGEANEDRCGVRRRSTGKGANPSDPVRRTDFSSNSTQDDSNGDPDLSASKTDTMVPVGGSISLRSMRFSVGDPSDAAGGADDTVLFGASGVPVSILNQPVGHGQIFDSGVESLRRLDDVDQTTSGDDAMRKPRSQRRRSRSEILPPLLGSKPPSKRPSLLIRTDDENAALRRLCEERGLATETRCTTSRRPRCGVSRRSLHSSSHLSSPSSRRQTLPIDEGDSQADMFRTGAFVSWAASRSNLAVQLDENFQPPVSVSEAEGIHSLALCLQMLGREMRNTLLAFEDLLQA